MMRIVAPLLLSVAVTAHAAELPARTPATANFRTCDQPTWPRDTLYDGTPGAVVLGFLVGEDGKVTDTVIRTSSGVPALDRAALDAIRRCKFKPATIGGVPVSSWTSVRYVWSADVSIERTLADFDTYRAGAKAGDAAARYKLAWLFREAYGIEHDMAQYARHLRASAESGYPQAEAELATNLRYGLNTMPKDPEQAMAWYRKAAEHGHILSQLDMGDYYDQPPNNDPAQAAIWFRKAADQGSADAQFRLGMMAAHGRGMPQDTAAAIVWYRKAADAGHLAAQAMLGHFYLQGQGVERDPMQAAAWLTRAAAQRQPSAEAALANLYFDGTGVPQSDTEGVKYLRRAAISSNIGAMRQLGQMLEQGSHMAADPKEAALWQAKVARLDKVITEGDVPRFGDW